MAQVWDRLDLILRLLSDLHEYQEGLWCSVYTYSPTRAGNEDVYNTSSYCAPDRNSLRLLSGRQRNPGSRHFQWDHLGKTTARSQALTISNSSSKQRSKLKKRDITNAKERSVESRGATRNANSLHIRSKLETQLSKRSPRSVNSRRNWTNEKTHRCSFRLFLLS